MKGKILLSLLAALVLAFSAWWTSAAPPAHVHVAADQYPLGAPSEALQKVRSAQDDVALTAVRTPGALPGYDDVVLQEPQGRAWATAMDGQIWRIELATGGQEPWVKTPLIPAGARADPNDPEVLYFCASRLYGVVHPPDEHPGIYKLHLPTRKIEAVALRVPATTEPPAREQVLAEHAAAYLAPAQMKEGQERQAGNSRGIAFCNDLDISADGRRLYFSEPYAFEGASMGGGAFNEAIARSRNSRLWLVDLDRGVRLAAEGFAFIDGVLIEPGQGSAREESVLVTETTNFRLLRLQLAGAGAGTHTVLQDSLPGLPDGLDRDPQGRLWIGLIKERSAASTWLHNNAWTKPLLLRLPHALLPVPKRTGLMALSADGRTPLFLSFHDGAAVPDISVVSAGKTALYPARFKRDSSGFASMPYPWIAGMD